MDYPKSVLRIVEETESRNYSSIPTAVREALEQIKELPEFAELQEKMFLRAVTELVCKARHEHNKSLKKEAGVYHTSRRVAASTSATKRVDKTFYTMRIVGTILGNITGSQIPRIIAQEKAGIRSKRKTVLFFEKLLLVVPENKTVQQSLSEKQLEQLYLQAEEEARMESEEV